MSTKSLPRLALLLAAAPALHAQGLVTLADGQDNTTDYELTDVIEFSVAEFEAATQSGVLSGSGAVLNSGLGTLTLTATNTYSGGTTLYDGTLAISSDANLGAASGPLIFDYGILQLLADVDLSARAVTVTAVGGGLDTNGHASSLSGVQAVGNFFRLGAGSLTLAGDNTFSAALASDPAGTLTIASGATVRIGDGTTTGYLAGAVAVEGTLVFNPSTIEETGYNGGFSPGEGLSGAGGVSKVGDGTLVITNANTYAGGTILSGGVTAILNTEGSAFGTGTVTVQDGATLTGEGFFTGALLLEEGGTLSPGAEYPYYITIGDGSILNGTTLIELESFDYFDTIEVGFEGSGTVTLGGVFDLSFFDDWAPEAPGEFQIFEAALLQGNYTSFNLPEGYSWDTSGLAAGGDGILRLTAIPEPSTYATLAALASLALAASRRRRN